MSALRLTIAAVPIYVYGLFAYRNQSPPPKHELLFLLAGLSLAVHFGTWIASLQFTSVAVSTLLVSTAPVWIALYDVFVLKRKIAINFWYALGAGALGTFIIVTADTACAAPVVGFATLGELLAAIGGLAIACYLIAIRSVAHLYPTLLAVGRTYSWAALVLVIAAALAHQSPPGYDAISWGGIFGMALISQMLGHTGINAALQFFPTSTVAFSTLLEPIFAAVLGKIFLSEGLSLQTLLGSVVVLLSLAVVLREQGREVSQEQSQEESQEESREQS